MVYTCVMEKTNNNFTCSESDKAIKLKNLAIREYDKYLENFDNDYLANAPEAENDYRDAAYKAKLATKVVSIIFCTEYLAQAYGNDGYSTYVTSKCKENGYCSAELY